MFVKCFSLAWQKSFVKILVMKYLNSLFKRHLTAFVYKYHSRSISYGVQLFKKYLD